MPLLAKPFQVIHDHTRPHSFRSVFERCSRCCEVCTAPPHNRSVKGPVGDKFLSSDTPLRTLEARQLNTPIHLVLQLRGVIRTAWWNRSLLTASSLHRRVLLPCHVKLSIPQSGISVENWPSSSASTIYGSRSGHDTSWMCKVALLSSELSAASPPSRAANPLRHCGGVATKIARHMH